MVIKVHKNLSRHLILDLILHPKLLVTCATGCIISGLATINVTQRRMATSLTRAIPVTRDEKKKKVYFWLVFFLFFPTKWFYANQRIVIQEVVSRLKKIH